MSGTAVDDWLDEDGNPKYVNDKDAPAAKAGADNHETSTEEQTEEQIAKDKAFNEAVMQAAKAKTSNDDQGAADEKAKAAEDENAVGT